MHLINFKELSSQDLNALVDLGIETKHNPKKFRKAFDGKSSALIFQKTSTRTRVSFEVAATQLGGHALFIDWRTTNFMLADIGDEIRYLSRNVDMIMARLLYDSDLLKMAAASRVPVINGCDDKYHPSEIVGDLITVKEKMGKLKGVKLVYIGVHNNVCNSLIEGCTKTGVKLTTVTPFFNEAARDDECWLKPKRQGFGNQLWTRRRQLRTRISFTPTHGSTWSSSPTPSTQLKKRNASNL